MSHSLRFHVRMLPVFVAAALRMHADALKTLPPQSMECAAIPQSKTTLSLVQKSAERFEPTHQRRAESQGLMATVMPQSRQSVRDLVGFGQRALIHAAVGGSSATSLLQVASHNAAPNETHDPIDLAREMRPETDVEKHMSLRSGLSEEGYQAVAALRSPLSMRRFMLRVAADVGLSVKRGHTLRGVLPYYDGTCARQSYWTLLSEIVQAQDDYACHSPWTVPGDNFKATRGAREALLERTKAQRGESNLVPSAKLDKAMSFFIRGLAKELGARIVDEQKLKVFSHRQVVGKISYEALLEALRENSQSDKDAFFVLPVSQKQAKTSVELKRAEETHPHAGDIHDFPSGIGSFAPPNDFGHKAVALVGGAPEMEKFFKRTKNADDRMAVFIRDMVRELNGTIRDEPALMEFARDYSGTQDSKPFWKLLEELRMFARQPHSWIKMSKVRDIHNSSEAEHEKEKVSNAVASLALLDESGYQQVVETGKTFEMKTYIRRVADSLGLEIVDEGGLSGFAPYYSSQCATQDLDRLSSELKAAVWRRPECGGGWIKAKKGDK